MGYKQKTKKNLKYAKLKVIEEASEVINELTDSFTKKSDNSKEILEELGHLQLRIDMLILEFQRNDIHAGKKVAKSYNDKEAYIEKYKQANNCKHA